MLIFTFCLHVCFFLLFLFFICFIPFAVGHYNKIWRDVRTCVTHSTGKEQFCARFERVLGFTKKVGFSFCLESWFACVSYNEALQ